MKINDFEKCLSDPIYHSVSVSVSLSENENEITYCSDTDETNLCCWPKQNRHNTGDGNKQDDDHDHEDSAEVMTR